MHHIIYEDGHEEDLNLLDLEPERPCCVGPVLHHVFIVLSGGGFSSGSELWAWADRSAGPGVEIVSLLPHACTV